MIAAATMSLVSYLAYAPQGTSPLLYPAYLIRGVVGHTLCKIVANSLFVLHGLECLYTMHLCRKHYTGFELGVGSEFLVL
jgi:hypothetical protein